MKVTMLDTVEVAHTIIPELEGKAAIKTQKGLTVLSQTDGSAGGMAGKHYVLNLSKGARISLPDRLGKKLVGFKYARAEWEK